MEGLKRRAVVDIDEKKCAFCGVCSDICYFNAITFKIDGEEKGSVLEEDFPKLVKKVIWDEALCDPTCNLCEMSCPTGAIEIGEDKERPYTATTFEFSEESCDLCGKCNGLCDALEISKDSIYFDEEKCDGCMKCVDLCPKDAIKIKKREKHHRSFNFDEEKCIACGWCQGVCPNAAIVQEGMYGGSVIIHTERCPENCRVCVDACPCKAIYGRPVEADSAYCMLCGACENACPEGAIEVGRERVRYGEGKGHSGTWFRALFNLTDSRAYAKEMHEISLNTSKKLL
jgi:Dissimilatory sulfite reductase (desulfoviridin), alpha and beta subunits